MFYPVWNAICTYSVSVQQVALLHRYGVIVALQCAEILDMLQAWKTH